MDAIKGEVKSEEAKRVVHTRKLYTTFRTLRPRRRDPLELFLQVRRRLVRVTWRYVALARPLAKRERDADEPEPRRVVRVGGGEGAPSWPCPG